MRSFVAVAVAPPSCSITSLEKKLKPTKSMNINVWSVIIWDGDDRGHSSYDHPLI